MVSYITPPVALGAFAASTIAGASALSTGFEAMRLGGVIYLAPFLFGYVPGFTLQGDSMDIVKTFILIIIGTYIYSYLFSFHWAYALKNKFSGKAEAA
jgi:TRAP-type uncharacterized transport system fused permease subunit